MPSLRIRQIAKVRRDRVGLPLYLSNLGSNSGLGVDSEDGFYNERQIPGVRCSNRWAHHADRVRDILEAGDIQEALTAAVFGNERLQMQARDYVAPASFTHGSSEQRVRWFKQGLDPGDINQCNTFANNQL